jgi:hypothetical protein
LSQEEDTTDQDFFFLRQHCLLSAELENNGEQETRNMNGQVIY